MQKRKKKRGVTSERCDEQRPANGEINRGTTNGKKTKTFPMKNIHMVGGFADAFAHTKSIRMQCTI